jgi:hypothetical protein
MQGAPKSSVAALLVFGLAIAFHHPEPATAAPGDGVMSGPMAAIAKARAAADKAEQRATTSNTEAAKTVDAEAAPQAEPKVGSETQNTAGSVGAATAPQHDASGEATDQAHGESAVEGKEAPHSTYDVAAHRDPFKPPRLNGTADARTPLQNYQLGQLKLVGVVAQPPAGYRAMVEDSAGLGYIITTGTPIGSSGGVVRSIEPRRVVIEESTRDFYGELKPKEVVMELPQEDRSP